MNLPDFASKRPRGRVPIVVSDFLQDYPEIPECMLVCETHKCWFSQIDPMAPYHWELCRCPKCP